MTKELILLGLYLAILVFLLLARKIQLVLPAIVAFGVAFIWTFVVGDVYGYNTQTVTFFGVNAYALLGWSVGLLVGYILYLGFQRAIRVQKGWQKFTLFNLIYIPLLLVVETTAYHVFNVVNVATSQYAGLPLCDCLHAPLWMQTSYILMGSVYFLVIQSLLRLRTQGLPSFQTGTTGR